MALIKFDTTQTGSIASASTTPLIVDMDVPVALDNYGTTVAGVATVDIAITDPAGNPSIQVEFGPDANGDPITEDGITENLNDLIEAAVADPYHIPEIASAFTAGAYLAPDNRFMIDDIKIV
tara:strand:+ start:355 stop:720 length:366 start_codon:yes stop_codon:yes gene_type:complete